MQVLENGRFIGLDLGKRTYQMCILNQSGKASFSGGTTTKQGIESLSKKLNQNDIVSMEACSLAFIIERKLREVGCKVIILNPRRLAIIYMSTKKTDKEDSLKLARLLKTHDEEDLISVTPPTDEEMRRRKLLNECNGLKRKRTQEINRLHAIFEHAGYTQFKRKDLATATNREKIYPLLTGYEKKEAERLDKRLVVLEEEIAELENEIKEEAKNDEKVQRAMQVPGVGEKTALAFVAYLGDLTRFDNAHQVSNFIGFTPKIDISCTIEHHCGISKQGNPLLRAYLVQAAWACVRANKGGALREKYEYMTKTKGKAKSKSIITIARKIGELLFVLLKNSTDYEVRKLLTDKTHMSDIAVQALKVS